MTTPEKFRMRQRVEGALLVCLGLLLIVSFFYSKHQADIQRDCVAQKFDKFAVAAGIRATVAEDEFKATHKVMFTVSSAKTSEQVVAALNEYKQTIADLQQRREDHPVPPFPAGACN